MLAKTKILIVEHDPNDLELLKNELIKGGIDYIGEVVQNEKDYVTALKNFIPDIILSDYTFPSFDGHAAFRIKNELAPDTPFILVSGTIGEENSIELIKNGVTDYALKDKLFTLNIKVKRALKEARENQEKSRTEKQLIQSERRLAKAQQVAHMGSWEIDLMNHAQIWSDGLYKVYGIENKKQPSTELFLSFMHPDDLAFAKKKVEKAFSSHIDSYFNFRFIREDGEVRHGYSEYRFEFDQNKVPVRLYGIVQDITEKKKAEQELQEEHNKLVFHIENTPLGFIEWDKQLLVKSCSKQAEEIFGWTEKEFQENREPGYLQVYKEDLPLATDISRNLLLGIVARNSVQYRNYTKDGRVIWCEWFNSALRDKNGEVETIMSLVQDITKRKNAEKERDDALLELEYRVEMRTKELIEKNKSILDSINYSKRIQIGLLSRPTQLTEIFPKSFILVLPRDIISGDFFWCYQRRNKKFIVVADCTGHGVPGALMSIIGNNLLNHIVVDEHIENPSEILELLDSRLAEAVKGDTQEVKDGMDIALCVVDTYFNELYFAGAYRPLFVCVEEGKINELPADRNSIGGGIQEVRKKFETKRFPIIPGQRIYLSSDGYYSQFGGPQGKKFMKSRFKKTLEQLQPLRMDEQKDALLNVLTEWSGRNDQVDDVMIVGIEL